jgi:hypothetical protein
LTPITFCSPLSTQEDQYDESFLRPQMVAKGKPRLTDEEIRDYLAWSRKRPDWREPAADPPLTPPQQRGQPCLPSGAQLTWHGLA